jgi:lysozyme
MILGFDKSGYDGTVNWQLAKSKHVDWTSMRVSSGLDEDKLYKSEFVKASLTNIAVVPYHYYIPKKYTPQAQADKFLSIIGHTVARCMIDLEDYHPKTGTPILGYKGIATKELKTWLDTVELATGKKPFIYTNVDYIKSYLQGETWLSEYPLIIANYGVSYPLVPSPWTPLGLAGWQFSKLSDAKYYGFEQALGCALQVIYDETIL